MATSGTQSFDLDLLEICEEAFDNCGLKMTSAYDYRLARRSLDLLFTEWQNRGINFWTLQEDTDTLTVGNNQLALGSEVIDAIEFFIRTGSGTSQVDNPITPVTSAEWASIPNKGVRGRPVNVWLHKGRDNHTLNLWPTPDSAYTLYTHKLVRIEDTGSPASNTTDVPHRFLPALTAGLAYRIASKRVPQRKADLKVDYEEQWALAEAGDRNRAPFTLKPNLRGYKP